MIVGRWGQGIGNFLRGFSIFIHATWIPGSVYLDCYAPFLSVQFFDNHANPVNSLIVSMAVFSLEYKSISSGRKIGVLGYLMATCLSRCVIK